MSQPSPAGGLSDFEPSAAHATPAQGAARDTTVDAQAARARREFAALLGEFRRRPVLVPLTSGADEDVAEAGLWTADTGGVRWILAFSDESALARFALARGAGSVEWTYQQVLGARLLDVAVPAVAAEGMPCGVALDAADGAEGVLFPPLEGIVPDAVAVDLNDDVGGGVPQQR
ncbi:hypothetical protein ACFQVC_02990 [Streptomyces monticola]|uniref:SseB family protein n=1 Tax=Streptomyces monticola TaxID=2666263 RepID=A0ABW2JBU0_9ACTN